MADLRKAEKLASAKKRLKQFQQKRDFQSESGRSTPSKKKSEDDDLENGGSTLSLSQSENLSSNISGTDSPVCVDAENPRAESVNRNGICSGSEMFPNVSQSLFQTLSVPTGQLNEISSVSAFFDSLTPPENGSLNPINPTRAPGFQLPKTSTPDGPTFEATPDFTFSDVSMSPIVKKELPLISSSRELESKVPSNGSLQNAVSEQRISEHDFRLQMSESRNAELEQQISEQKSHILQLQSHLEDMKKKADESASTLKHHLKAIEILVAEKTELQNALDKRQEEERSKESELREYAERLGASRHQVAELERELESERERVRSLDASLRSLDADVNDARAADHSNRKRVGDLELEVSDLQSKVRLRDQAVDILNVELEKQMSQLSLAEVRIEQLSDVEGSGVSAAVAEQVRCQNELLSELVGELRQQLAEAADTAAESLRGFQRHVARLQADLDHAITQAESKGDRCRELETREQQLVARLSELERELSNAAAAAGTDTTPRTQQLNEELAQAEAERKRLQDDLDRKNEEINFLRTGLEERALRIQEAEAAVARLEADRPDAARLQAAIESDKVAASRAVAQNNNLKKQLEELQEALVTLSNNKLELTERLQNEQYTSKDLSHRLESVQGARGEAVDNAQQTERPPLKESTVQTLAPSEPVNQEMMCKLEEKFNRKMAELAELSDEKQRLEHLVLQLQGETETIGEYITLYQIQRGMLRQRAQEKDEQVAQLGRDKEALRNKLAQLNTLVQQLLPDTPNTDSADAGEAATPGSEGGETEVEATADRIRSLLSEIGSSNLVSSELTFHPCQWCSGRLITV